MNGLTTHLSGDKCNVVMSFLVIFLMSGCGFFFVTPTVPATRGRLSIAPDGLSVIFDFSGRQGVSIYGMSIDGSHITSLWNDVAEGEGYEPKGAVFSPDGNQIVYEMYPLLPEVAPGRERSEIYIYNFSTGERRRLTYNNRIDSGATFSPDGSKIIFWRAQRYPFSLFGHALGSNYDLDIFMINTDGTNEKRITFEKYDLRLFILISPPVFSPDGKKIVFSAYPRDGTNGNSNQIHLLDADERAKPRPITKGSCDHIWPSFSPDGSKIVYLERCLYYGIECDIWLMEADGSHPVQITNSKFWKQSPVFSRDGKRIYFLAGPENIVEEELWVVDADGKNPHRITKLED